MKAKVNDIELYYERYGEGDPIIFSHGWLDDCSLWNSQTKVFATTHTVILYDHRGHGKSDKPRGDYSVQTLSGDLHYLIQMLKFEKVTLVGFSLGGMAALMFTLQHPTKVIKLVLVGTTAKMAMSVYTLYALRYFLPYRTFARIVSRVKIYKPSQEIIKDNISRAMAVPKHVAYKCMEEFTRNWEYYLSQSIVGLTGQFPNSSLRRNNLFRHYSSCSSPIRKPQRKIALAAARAKQPC